MPGLRLPWTNGSMLRLQRGSPGGRPMSAKPRSRAKHIGRRESGTFSLIPHAVQDSANWKRCGGTAIKLLCDLIRQFKGHNNGDLTTCRTVMAKSGWKVPETLHFAALELEHYGLIIRTKQGGLQVGPNLYALTWVPVDDCRGKHDHPPTKTPTGDWKIERPRYRRPQRSEPVRIPQGYVRSPYLAERKRCISVTHSVTADTHGDEQAST